MKILTRDFYRRSTIDVARDVLGKILVRVIKGKVLSGIIVESEAYRSVDDPASHSYRGKTERNRVMFGNVGHAYVYFSYGNHYCLNLVAKEDEAIAGAVLIRALEPLDGIRYMEKWRGTKDLRKLMCGPGNLTKALHVTKQHNGLDLTRRGELYVAKGKKIEPRSIIATSRIGITNALDKEWRFMIADSNFVSRKVNLLKRLHSP